MGCFPNLMSSSSCSQPAAVPRPSGNPNPHFFQVRKMKKFGRFFVALVRYPHCNNFEGDKVLVLTKNPAEMRVLDPHFQPGGYIVARFRPTTEGFDEAELFVDALRRR